MKALQITKQLEKELIKHMSNDNYKYIAYELLKISTSLKEELRAISVKYKNIQSVVELQELQTKFTRVEVISSLGRVFCDRCDNDRHYRLSIQDNGKTLKIFEIKDTNTDIKDKQ